MQVTPREGGRGNTNGVQLPGSLHLCSDSPLLIEGGVVECCGHDPGPVMRAVGPEPPGDADQLRTDRYDGFRTVEDTAQLPHSLIWGGQGKRCGLRKHIGKR